MCRRTSHRLDILSPGVRVKFYAGWFSVEYLDTFEILLPSATGLLLQQAESFDLREKTVGVNF